MSEVVLPEKNAFNALRLLCCLVIIAGHCLDLSGLSQVVPFRPVLDMHVCVCVFFILSGFFVTRSYLQKKENGEGVLQFYKRRALRILSPYYLVVLLCAVCFYFLSGYTAKEYFGSATFRKYIFWNALLLNFMCPSPVKNGGGQMYSIDAVNGALWTIKVEVAFYLVLPLVVFIIEKIRTKKGKNGFLCACYVLSVIWNLFLKSWAKNTVLLLSPTWRTSSLDLCRASRRGCFAFTTGSFWRRISIKLSFPL